MKLRLVLLSCALALAAFAADVTGKWTYEMRGRNGAMTGTMNLKADGDKVTGTVSGRNGDTEISDGKIDGDAVTFTVVREFNGNKVTLKYTGTVTADGIKFKVEREGSDRPPQEFTAKKTSAT
jgi:hypothetical protein